MFPFYIVPVPNRDGHWLFDSTRQIQVSTFDDFNPSMIVAQLNYLISPQRTAMDFNGESGQAVFDHISGALLDYARLQDDYNSDLSSVINREFLSREYEGLVAAAKPIVVGGGLLDSPYKMDFSEKLNPTFSWYEAQGRAGEIEKKIGFMVDYLRRCDDSIPRFEERIQEFEKHSATAKGELTTEFESFKTLKAKEEADLKENCESSRQNVEKTYKPLLSKAEKQLKAAKETNDSAQLELMPARSVYDDMRSTASKLQDSITQSKAAREEAVQKASEFRAKYNKLQEDQSNIQSRSSKTADKTVPEDTPLDAEMAYLERQALNYESKQQQLDEELKRLADDQNKSNMELEKFEKGYLPMKEKADEAKAIFEKRGEELENLKQQKTSELETIDSKCQGELARIKSEVADAEAALGNRLYSIDKSVDGLKSSVERLKTTLAAAKKYADETITPSIDSITIAGAEVPKAMFYPFYVCSRKADPTPTFVMGRAIRSATSASDSGVSVTAPIYAPGPIDYYVQGRLASFQWKIGTLNFFDELEFKGRVIMGLKQLASKGSITENRLLKLAREVAVANLSLA